MLYTKVQQECCVKCVDYLHFLFLSISCYEKPRQQNNGKHLVNYQGTILID